MPTIEVNASSTAKDYCFACDTTTVHNAANIRWEDGSREYLCRCSSCGGIHYSVLDSRVPHASHQQRVHETAQRYLRASVDQNEKSSGEISTEFRQDWLFALQVMEEAMVLQQNQPSQWPLDDYGLQVLQHNHARIKGMIEQLRGGRARASTTPTLPGGGTRG